MPRPMPKKLWSGISYWASSGAVERGRRRAGSSRPPYSVGPVIQPRPASKRLARHALASASSCGSSLAVDLLEEGDVVVALAPHELLSASSRFGSALASRKAVASASNSSMVGWSAMLVLPATLRRNLTGWSR